ncbi:hypothetical protein [Flavobacterium quisquiliarum]|uniref:DUF3592 domain-containing protein n=1 Tax=Flavobacterium quisquiliarum TaxID=1834436 RepID=A0ABV8W3V4_9FLAO|nr:hypothetical protein [Flavobacterium quisquiliarum]MBW1655186.1 hypothetical protein [Flavobacterium quisquiliarum]NWL02779.1 hypothetical protein [Flavobacterium collinsii]
MIYNKENFPKVTSQRNVPVTLLVYVLFGLLCFAMLLLFAVLPLSIQLEHNSRLSNGEMIFDLIYFPLLLWGVWALCRNYQHQKLKKIISISVDHNGIHHHQYNGAVESILYKELERSTEIYVSDIDRKIGTKYSPSYIFGFKEGKQIPIHFSKPADGMTYIPKNKYQLIGHFLHGVSLFSPNLKVSQAVYTDYFINPKTFEFDKKAQRITYFIIFIVIILILIGIDLFIKYTKGFSILFN